MRRIALIACAVAVAGMMIAPAADAKKKHRKKKVAPVVSMAASNAVAPEQTASATATCAPNKTLTGGGFASGPLEGLMGPEPGTLVLESHRDAGNANAWTVKAINLSSSTPGTVSAYAYCRKRAAPLSEDQVTIDNACACLPIVTAVATCSNGGRAVAGGFAAPFDLNDGGAFPQASRRFGAFAWRFDALDESFDGAKITSYAYCAPRARTETTGVRVITSDPNTGLGNGTAYAQLCHRRGQRMLAGGFQLQPFDVIAGTIQLASQSAADNGRFATTAAQSGFGGDDGTLQSFGYCG
jgi:hypothetical protein